jgi:hypothetical protein
MGLFSRRRAPAAAIARPNGRPQPQLDNAESSDVPVPVPALVAMDDDENALPAAVAATKTQTASLSKQSNTTTSRSLFPSKAKIPDKRQEPPSVTKKNPAAESSRETTKNPVKMSSRPMSDEEAVAAADKEMEARANRAKELLSQRYVGLKRQQVRRSHCS